MVVCNSFAAPCNVKCDPILRYLYNVKADHYVRYTKDEISFPPLKIPFHRCLPTQLLALQLLQYHSPSTSVIDLETSAPRFASTTASITSAQICRRHLIM